MHTYKVIFTTALAFHAPVEANVIRWLCVVPVVDDGGTVYLFQTNEDAAQMKWERCLNAVIRDDAMAKLLRRTSGSPQRVQVRVHARYFEPVDWSYDAVGGYKFNGKPLNPTCEHRDLYEVIALGR